MYGQEEQWQVRRVLAYLSKEVFKKNCDDSLVLLNLSLPECMVSIAANCAALQNPFKFHFFKNSVAHIYNTFTVSICCFRFANPPQSLVQRMYF